MESWEFALVAWWLRPEPPVAEAGSIPVWEIRSWRWRQKKKRVVSSIPVGSSIHLGFPGEASHPDVFQRGLYSCFLLGEVSSTVGEGD